MRNSGWSSDVCSSDLIDPDLVASIQFSATPDLSAEFPAVAAREAGYTQVALECVMEMNVPGSLAKCLRILMHVNPERPLAALQHVSLRGARVLRRSEERRVGKECVSTINVRWT